MENKDTKNIFLFDQGSDEQMYSSSAWMMTLADLLSLLLVFFILIYSMSSIKTGEWDQLIDSMGEAFNADKIIQEGAFSSSLGVSKVKVKSGLDLNYLYSVLDNKVKSDSFLSDTINLNYDENKLIISLNNKDLFSKRGSSLNEDAELILFVIGDILQKINNKVEVTGYLQATKAKQGNTTAKWATTLEKASNIAEEMRKYGNLSRMSSVVSFYKYNQNEAQIYHDDLINIIIKPHAKEF